MAGRYFDQWAVGDRIVHEIRRTVTETDNLLFSTMTHNPQPLHLDAEAAKASEFGQILVKGTFTLALPLARSMRTRSPVRINASPPIAAASGEALRIEGDPDVPDCRPSPMQGRAWTPSRIR